MSLELPDIFKDFCEANLIDPAIYDQSQKQYFYLRDLESSDFDSDSVFREGKAVPCDLIPNFYQINLSDNFQFSRSKFYQAGKVLPMDLSSGFAVSLLDLRGSDHLLDLCCAPGGKLVLASFFQGPGDFSKPEHVGTLTGVDLSSHRLSTCRSLIKKYKVERARLFCADGTSFNEPVREFSKPLTLKAESSNRAFHETSAFRKRPTRLTFMKYDKVLVDAQCTHDGSIKHIRKHRQNNWKGFDLKQFKEENLIILHQLQFGLLENGFKMLKLDGILIYSTCSLSRGQNEDIITKFMTKYSDCAKPEPFPGSDEFGQLRMCPPDFDSGFFICRIKRIKE